MPLWRNLNNELGAIVILWGNILHEKAKVLWPAPTNEPVTLRGNTYFLSRLDVLMNPAIPKWSDNLSLSVVSRSNTVRFCTCISHDIDVERPGIGYAVGRISFIDAYQQHEMDLNTRRRSAAQLASVHGALARIEKGNYGICERCGQEINPERLEYLPETPFCTGCNAR